MRRRGGERERGERKGGEFDVGSQAHHPPAAFLSFSTAPPPRPHSSRKSMPALLVFLPSLAKARRRGEQTSGLLVRPWPAVCDAIWELFPSFPFRMGCLLRADRTDRAPSHLKTSTRDLNWTHPIFTPHFPPLRRKPVDQWGQLCRLSIL